MFAINGLEVLLAVVWLAGIACAVTRFVHGRRGISGVAIVAAAVMVPILGSLLAIGMFAVNRRPTPMTPASG
jgi:hypothetical protein